MNVPLLILLGLSLGLSTLYVVFMVRRNLVRPNTTLHYNNFEVGA